MSTLIRNIGILDARKAAEGQIAEISKLSNIGTLVVSPANKAELLKVNMQNIGSILELDDDYKLQVGQFKITKEMLEKAEKAIKLCIVGQVTVDEDIPPELLQEKLTGLYLVGQASVPQHLYGVFMNSAKEITGQVSAESAEPDNNKKKVLGKILINNDYLDALEDATVISVVGKVTLAEEVDEELFLKKIKKLKTIGVVAILNTQEAMLRKVWTESEASRLKVTRPDYHYISSGTVLDEFTLLTIEKPVVSCAGQMFLDEGISAETISGKTLSFDAAGAVYFPKTLMQVMASRLTQGTKGIPYESEKLEIFSGEQNLTNVRLEAMADKSTLVVLGELNVEDNVTVEIISAKIGALDNYGEITSGKDVASILQSKLRQNEGEIQVRGEEGSDDDGVVYDVIIENSGTYTL